MRTKLSDAEFVERARASARRRSERQRLRKLESGKIQVNHWLTAPAKERLDALATELNASPSEVVTAAILAYRATPRPSSSVVTQSAPESLPLFEPASTGREPPLTCINADLNSLVEGGSVKGEPAKPAPGTTAERDALIVALHGQGVSYRQIAARLAEQGYLSANGTPLSIGQIGRILERTGLKKGE